MSKGTKKDLLARLEKRMFVFVTEALDKFRNAVNESMEINMARLGQIVQASAAVVDAQNDRVNAVVDVLIDKNLLTEEEFLQFATSQRERREEAIRVFREEREAKKKLAEAEAQLEAERAEKGDAVLKAMGAVDDAPHDLSALGSHPPAAEVFGG